MKATIVISHETSSYDGVSRHKHRAALSTGLIQTLQNIDSNPFFTSAQIEIPNLEQPLNYP